MRGQIARRGAQMNVPTVPIKPGNVLPDLHAAEVLTHAAGASYCCLAVECAGGREKRRSTSARGYVAGRVRSELIGDFAANAARPDAAAFLVGLRIAWRGHEGAALLAEKSRAHIA